MRLAAREAEARAEGEDEEEVPSGEEEEASEEPKRGMVGDEDSGTKSVTCTSLLRQELSGPDPDSRFHKPI